MSFLFDKNTNKGQTCPNSKGQTCPNSKGQTCPNSKGQTCPNSKGQTCPNSTALILAVTVHRPASNIFSYICIINKWFHTL